MAIEKLRERIIGALVEGFERIDTKPEALLKEVSDILDEYDNDNITDELTKAVNNLDGRLTTVEEILAEGAKSKEVPFQRVVDYMEHHGCTQQEAIEALS